MGDTHGDAGSLAREWRDARRAILELAERLPETRAYRNTARAGWTLKHELSHLASLDDEVMHLLGGAGSGVASALDPALLRRRRGEAMHAAHMMRLGPLREHLAAAGEAVARAIEERGGAAAGTLEEQLRARVERARGAVVTFREHLGE